MQLPKFSQFNVSLLIIWLISLAGAIVLKETQIFIASIFGTLFLATLEAILFFERLYVETNEKDDK